MLGSEIRDAAVRSPVPGADPNAVISLINTIELLPDSATGALIFAAWIRAPAGILSWDERVPVSAAQI